MAKNKKKSDNKNRNEGSNEGRKVVVNTASKKAEKKKLAPTSSKSSRSTSSNQAAPEMLFGRENFILIGVGALLVVIGLFLMTGGAQELNEWNDAEVYSARRTVIAPLFILAGLITELFAIFKKKAVKETF